MVRFNRRSHRGAFAFASAMALVLACACFATMAHAITMYDYAIQVFDGLGNPVVYGAHAYVYVESTLVQMQVYDLAGSPLDQPLDQGADGLFRFQVAQGHFDFSPYGPGVLGGFKIPFTAFDPDSVPYLTFGPLGTAPAAPDTGTTYYSESAGGLRTWDGGAWVGASGGGGIADLVEDATPQLGGDLDVNDHGITNASGNVVVTAPASGSVVITAADPGAVVLTGDAVVTDSLLVGGDLTMSAGDITMSASATVDGRDVSADGAVIDALGSAAQADSGVAIGSLVALRNVGGSAALPAVDGSLLTNLPGGGGASVENDAYGVGWDGDTSNAPSQNAVFDKMLAVNDSLITAATKLAGIEAGADVTDTANVTAAGALMDSEVDADIQTLSLPASTTISTFGATVIDDADAAAARTTLDVDQAGTDNSTDVTLAGTPDYITISGQVITRGSVDLAADVTGNLAVSHLNGGTNASSSTYWSGAGTWTTPAGGGGGSGDVSGPGASTLNAIPLFADTAGDTLKDSGITISAGILSGLSGLACPSELYLDGTGGGMTVSENYASDVVVSFENSGAGRLGITADGTVTCDSLIANYVSGSSTYKVKDKQSLYITSPTATDTLLIGVATVDCTIDSIRCTTDTGTVDYDILTRAAGTPFSGGTQVIGTDDQASSTSSLATISDGDYNAGEVLTFLSSAVSGSPGKLFIVVYFSED